MTVNAEIHRNSTGFTGIPDASLSKKKKERRK
jgi:hypothetical protein